MAHLSTVYTPFTPYTVVVLGIEIVEGQERVFLVLPLIIELLK
uniref:Uncharacterized protein n=1 Tax=Tetraselmis sp. GSL018 TaxID=582737 RepID=A0A061RY56_9CHLO